MMLEEYVDKLHVEFELLVLSSGIKKEEARDFLGLMRVGMGTERIADAAARIAEVVLRGLKPHLVLKLVIEEAEETGIYSKKDLAELLQMAHKMRMDEIKAQADLLKAETTNIRNQTNVQINDAALPFGQGNYGKLMEKLLNGDGQ